MLLTSSTHQLDLWPCLLPPTKHDVCHMWNSLCGESPCRFRSTYLVTALAVNPKKIIVWVADPGDRRSSAPYFCFRFFPTRLLCLLINVVFPQLATITLYYHNHPHEEWRGTVYFLNVRSIFFPLASIWLLVETISSFYLCGLSNSGICRTLVAQCTGHQRSVLSHLLIPGVNHSDPPVNQS